MKGLFRGPAGAEIGKLGSDGDPIRQMLFGSQTLQEQVQRIRLDGSSGPLSRIVDWARNRSSDCRPAQGIQLVSQAPKDNRSAAAKVRDTAGIAGSRQHVRMIQPSHRLGGRVVGTNGWVAVNASSRPEIAHIDLPFCLE
jgi:hypothetical protein